jgi:hypothetical protein
LAAWTSFVAFIAPCLSSLAGSGCIGHDRLGQAIGSAQERENFRYGLLQTGGQLISGNRWLPLFDFFDIASEERIESIFLRIFCWYSGSL